MITPALALLLALAGSADTVRVAPVVADSVPATLTSRMELPVSLQLDADTTPDVHDGMDQRIAIGLGPYSVVILSQDD